MVRQQMAIERESVGQMEVIRFETPELGSLPKVSSHIAQSDILSVVIQVVSKDGGETNLHAHSGQDAVWFVLAGRAKFYGKDDEVVELGPKDALFIPKGVPYWFESSSDRAAGDHAQRRHRCEHPEPARQLRSAARPPAGRTARGQRLRELVGSPAGRCALPCIPTPFFNEEPTGERRSVSRYAPWQPLLGLRP